VTELDGAPRPSRSIPCLSTPESILLEASEDGASRFGVFDLSTGHRPGRSATSRCVPWRSSGNGLTRDRVLRGMAHVAPLKTLGSVVRLSKT
jgi:hypothetical protein